MITKMCRYITYSLLLAALCIGNLSQAQTWQKTDLGIKAEVNSIAVEVQFFSPSIARIIKSPAGRSFSKESLSVIKKPQQTSFVSKQLGDVLNLKTSALNVSVNLKSGQITFADIRAAQLLKEKEGSTNFTSFNDAGNNTFSVTQAYSLALDEDIYGLGQQQRGKMSQRNVSLNMVQGNTDDYVPFFLSVKGYGLFWDNYSPTAFKDNPDGTSFKSEVGDCIDYYFMQGGNADGVIANMRDLTGQAPMFPLWTYGFFQSKERYKSQNELLDVVKKHRDLKVPLDGIIQDWQYWGNNYLWNAMDFLNPEFSNPQKMVDDVHKLNAHMLISIWNSFGPQTKQYKELEKINALMNFTTWPQSGSEKWPPNRDYPSGVRVYDPYNPEARDIYWKYLKGLLAYGIDGWWMDSSEPDHLDFKPSDMDNKTYLGSFRKVRNAFPLMTVGGVFKHQRAADSSKRIFILTRSAFAGQQRYGANTWSGDVNSSWETLRNQIPAGLNFSMTAIPYWNSDIGGFFASAYGRGWNEGAKNPSFQELYVRWLQFGAFTPMMRSHGTDIPREIYNFGKKGEPIFDAIAKAINLRYSLLPYIYSTSWAVTNQQSTFMRALVMDFSDKKVANMNNEYMFGKSILVAPVVRAQYTPETLVKSNAETGWDKNDPNSDKKSQSINFTEIKSTQVYLPEGSAWYDFWTNEKIDGGKEIAKATTIDAIPLYIKAGSIIPIGPEVQYATEKPWDNLELRIYPGANGKFVLYEDEFDNYNYEKGKYTTIAFNWDDAKKTLTIGDRMGGFLGMLKSRTFKIVMASAVSGGMNKSGKVVLYSNKKSIVKL